MKKYILLLLLIPFLLGSGPRVIVDGDPQVSGSPTFYGRIFKWYQGINSETVEKTIEAITLYVATTGSDSNNCLTSGTACLTFQEAINRVPVISQGYAVQISIGAGSFAGFLLNNKFFPKYTKLTITGTLDYPTLTTGTTTGTATGGSTIQVIDAAQTWTVNELEGMFVKIAGEVRPIYSSNATTLYLSGALSATASGKAYEILEPTTIINSIPTDPNWAGWSMIEIYGSAAGTISNLRIDCQAQSYDGFDIVRTIGATVIENVQIIEPYYGIYAYGGFQVSVGYSYIEDAYDYGYYGVHLMNAQCYGNYIYNSGDDGIYLGYNQGSVISGVTLSSGGNGVYAWGNSIVDFDNPLIINSNTGHGIVLHFTSADIDDATIESNGGNGIKLGHIGAGNRSGQSYVNIGSGNIASNGASGIYVVNGSSVMLKDVSGAANTGYGLEVTFDGTASITSDTDFTGTSGDATINEGTTALVWATDFNDNGDTVINVDNGCIIKRVD